MTDLSTSLGVDIGDKNADRKSIVAQVADVVIKSGIDNGEYNVTDWGAFTQEQVSFENYMGSLGVPEPSLDLDINSDEHEHDDGTVHSHEGGDEPHHHHEDGTTHDHEGGDEPHTHDDEEHTYEDEEEEELPDFTKMSKKALDEWAEERDIILDRRKTKAHMFAELNKQL